MKTIRLVTLILLGGMADATTPFIPSQGCLVKGLEMKGDDFLTSDQPTDNDCDAVCKIENASRFCTKLNNCCEAWTRTGTSCSGLRNATEPVFEGKGKGVTSWVKDRCTVVKKDMAIEVMKPWCFNFGRYTAGVVYVGKRTLKSVTKHGASQCKLFCERQQFQKVKEYDRCDVTTMQMNYTVQRSVMDDFTATCLFYAKNDDKIRFDNDKTVLSGPGVCGPSTRAHEAVTVSLGHVKTTKNKKGPNVV